MVIVFFVVETPLPSTERLTIGVDDSHRSAIIFPSWQGLGRGLTGQFQVTL